jgi:hypothetical protein
MGEVILGRAPSFPLTVGDGSTYGSLVDVGTYFEFLDERQLERYPDDLVVFTDVSGQRFRILVISLTVVLCVGVPADFDPRSSELAEVRAGSSTVVLEHFGGEVHRGLLLGGQEDQEARALSVVEIASLPTDWVHTSRASTLDWETFDLAWFESVDPSPPIGIGGLLRSFWRALRPW